MYCWMDLFKVPDLDWVGTSAQDETRIVLSCDGE
jgi:hypothetical protein